ncbi:MAG: small basic protein [Candidatus Omnitrophica bacterium]|nr:small basic protein [Candidatus Omnitrophota bacterium]
MSIHPSLKTSGKDEKDKSVLKRIERLRIMMEKNQWKEGDAVCGLPKMKTLRIKIKKEKAAAEKTDAAAGAAETPAKAPAAAGKAAAGKAPAGKAAEKK